MFFSFFKAYTQYECFMEESSSAYNIILNSLDNIDFFTDESCDPLYLNCNFVFLTRDDGTGTFPVNDPLITGMINGMNSRWASIKDPANCALDEGYPKDSKVRVSVDVHYISNIDAWDYYEQAVSMGNSYYHDDFCPGSIVSSNSTWPALKIVVDEFNNDHPNSFNFFFVENGAHLEFLENAVENSVELTEPWDDTNNIKIFDGCSRHPVSFNSDRDQFIIIADAWTEYYARINFGVIYYPGYADEGNETIANWYIWGLPTLYNHELGHTIIDIGHPCGCKNLMIGRGCNPEWEADMGFVPDWQLNRMHKTLMTKNLHKFIECESLTSENCNIEVIDDETIDQPISIFGDIIIKSGATLTITSEVYLSEESDIDLEENAKLIVDGGLLTSACSNTWNGIRVTGGNMDFDVKFTNGAVIENTHHAAVSMFPPLPTWNEMAQHGNGILQAENTTFNNVKRIVELIAFTPSYNPSYVKDYVQNGGKWSITNWNCYGVEIIDNIFNDITHEAIVTEVGQFLIEGNEIHSGNADILFANVSPGFGTQIFQNQFYGDNTGVRALGTTFGQNEISYNQFLTGEFDIFMDGTNNYLVSHNDLTADFGVVSFDNGYFPNEVNDNDITGNFIGIMPLGFNDGYIFYNNCYNTSYSDAWIDGFVNSVIANPNDFGPANNCFTHDGNAGSWVYDMTGYPDPFVYVEPADENVDCRDAVKAHASISRAFNDIVDNPCPTAGSGYDPPPPQYNPCHPQRTIWDMMRARGILKQKISEIENDPNLTDDQKIYLISFYKRCLKRVTWWLYEKYLKEGKYREARELMSENNTDDAKIAVFSSYLYENNLTEAKNYLLSLPDDREQLSDFKSIQMINLERVKYGKYYKTNPNEMSVVENLARKNHPFAGFAKALFYHLTGEIISSEIPEFEDRPINPRSINTSKLPVMNVFPNPVSNELEIQFSNIEEGRFRIIDVLGNEMFRGDTNSNMKINTANWSEGIYIITLEKGNEKIARKKIMVIH